MNTESIEHLSILVWLVVAAWLGFLALCSKPMRSPGYLRIILWGAFGSFSLTWIPVMSFGVIAVPSSFSFIESLVALPFDDGSERFYGVSRLSGTTLVIGIALIAGVSIAALASFIGSNKSKKGA